MEPDPKVLGTRLASKVAIVTGGGSGFGEAISKRFAAEGCKVIVADLDPVGGQRVATFQPHEMHFIKTNVASEEDWEQLMENALAKWGRVDILVNNAGTSYKNKVCIVIFDTLKEQDVKRNLAKRASYGR
jgi:NAD(P)-dependent dehydrogenase (short-subunit alcohol dehydrogenase family)